MAAIAAPAIAEAQIVYSGVLNTSHSSGNVTLIFQGTPTPGSDMELHITAAKKGSSNPVMVYVNTYGHTAVDHTAAAVGDTVDSSRTFTTTLFSVFPNVANTSYYYGFSYAPEGETLYGWFHYTLVGIAPNATMVLNDWAYNTVAGQAITIGQTEATVAVPETSAFAALLGLAALGAAWSWRRRRPNSPAL